MKARKSALASLALAVVACLAFATSTQASDNTEPMPPVMKSNPDISQEVVDSLPDIIKNNPDVIISPDYKPGMKIVYPDGSPVPGQSPTQASYPAGPFTVIGLAGMWSGESVSNTAVLDTPGRE